MWKFGCFPGKNGSWFGRHKQSWQVTEQVWSAGYSEITSWKHRAPSARAQKSLLNRKSVQPALASTYTGGEISHVPLAFFKSLSNTNITFVIEDGTLRGDYLGVLWLSLCHWGVKRKCVFHNINTVKERTHIRKISRVVLGKWMFALNKTTVICSHGK